MLHDAPPGTGLILSITGILISLVALAVMVYAWITGLQSIAMAILGFVVFITIMVVVFQARSGEDENDDKEEEQDVDEDGLYDDI